MSGRSQAEPLELVQSLTRLSEGTRLLGRHLRAVEMPGLRSPTLLSGWSQAHLLAHLSQNARALGNLVTWARTRVPTPMYTNPNARSADIESTASMDIDALLDAFDLTARDLEGQMASLPSTSWDYPVRSALGRTIPVSQVPWLRNREIWLHAIDLQIGITFDHLPIDLTDALIADIGKHLSSKANCPIVTMIGSRTESIIGSPGRASEPSQRDPNIQRAESSQTPGQSDLAYEDGLPLVVTGSESLLLGWLSGRTDGFGLHPNVLPALPRWI